MKARPILIALFALGIGACTTPTADRQSRPTQSSMERSIDAAFDDVYARYRLPGLALGVVRNGEVIYTRAAGETIAGFVRGFWDYLGPFRGVELGGRGPTIALQQSLTRQKPRSRGL